MNNNKLRLCKVRGELGYFHCWEHYSDVIPASPLVGGAPAGVISRVFGIVETANGVKRVDASLIQFCDEINANLNTMGGEHNVDKKKETKRHA